jgi:hypothetical protein
MRTLDELKNAVANKVKLVWNDPDPIEGADYEIKYIEPLDAIEEEGVEDYPILIQYGGGSEAQVFLHEILLK